MKTLNSVSYVAPRENSVFTIFTDEVHEVKINKVIFLVEKDEEGEPRIKFSHYVVEDNVGGIATLPVETKFYASMDDYRKLSPIEVKTENGGNLIRRTWSGGSWWFNGVEAVLFEPTDSITEFAILPYSQGEIIKGSVPSELYSDSDAVYAYNDITVVDIDGNKGVKRGTLSPLLFNEKQREIMKRFKAITEEMKAADIRSISLEDSVYFVNGEHISDIMNEYDSTDESVFFRPAKEHWDHSLRHYWTGYEDIHLEFKA